MAAGIPKEKSLQLIEKYGDMLRDGLSLNDIEYMRAVRELEQVYSSNSVSALGILHALAGKTDKADKLFESEVWRTDNPQAVALNHCFMLQYTGRFERVRQLSYIYADRFESKKFSRMAYSHAYRYGDREALENYMDMHIKLLSEEEGRSMAEKHKFELISEVDDAYSSGCTKEQFFLLASLTHEVIQDYSAKAGRIEVSKNGSNSYIVDIYEKNSNEIARMNFSLAEKICMDERLDTCELTARFSSERKLHTGVSYDSISI